nr:ribonuclease-like storage protein [Malus domestica]
MHFFKIVLVVIALCFVTYLGKSNAATPYDIFQFVQQSPIVFCLRSGICGNQPVLRHTFTTHGLWLSNFTDPSAPILCAGTLFDRNQMNADHNLQLLLSNSWPNFNIRRTNMDFWAHEYNKHGSKIRPILEALEHQIKLRFSSLGNLLLIAVILTSDTLFKSSTFSAEPLA